MQTKNHPLIEALERIEAAALGNDRLYTMANCGPTYLPDLFRYALSDDITFGLKQVPGPDTSDFTTMDSKDWWNGLVPILDGLAERSLTGATAKRVVSKFLGMCNPLEVKWTSRIIKQDLRLGFGASSVNEVWPGTITQFKIPLAKPFKDLKSLNGRWALQPKMDGGRVVARLTKNGGPVKLLSRTGKEWKGFQEIKDSLIVLNKELNLPVDMTIDGEVIVNRNGRMDFQEIQKLFHAEDGRKPNGDLVYIMFDYCTSDEYDNPTMTYGYRFADLVNTVNKYTPDLKNLGIIASDQLLNPKKEFLDTKAIEFVDRFGCDGAIIRRTDKVPQNKKSSDITKVKPFEDAEAEIIGKVEGKGWLVGSLGTMVCQIVVKGEKVGPKFEIGTGEGLTKELRQELWDDKDLVGKLVNFKYQRLSDDSVPILPTFRGIRHRDDV
jgi:DNA ligase-1